ncbi:hypothetical protein ACR6C2_37265 [Streptomyces sp. INA 01156]
MTPSCCAVRASPIRCAASGNSGPTWPSGGPAEPPGLAAFLTDAQARVKGYADDRTAAAVWEA